MSIPLRIMPFGASLTREEVRHYAPSVFAEHAHESRSDKYVAIPTYRIYDELIAQGWVCTAAGQSRTRDIGKRGYTKHLLRFRRPEARPIGIGDMIPEIVLINSHVGSSAYILSAGLFRLACLNGLVVKSADFGDIRVRHSGEPREVIGRVIEGSAAIVDLMPRIIARQQQMAMIKLAAPERVAFAQAAIAARWPDASIAKPTPVTAPVTAEQVIRPRRHVDQAEDLWTTVNVVQENLLKGGLYGRTATGRRMHTRAVSGVDNNLTLNRALWVLAEEMAKLKGHTLA